VRYVDKNEKRQIINYIHLRNFCIIVCTFFIQLVSAQSIPNETIPFDFRYSDDYDLSVLYLSVTNNQASYNRLVSAIREGNTRLEILSGRKYVSLVSCIMNMDIGEGDIINRASEQASVVRALLKTRFGIPHECIAFSIDTTQGRRNRVYLNIFSGELPQGERSNEIQYVQKGNRDKVLDKYVYGIPYGNYWMILKRNNRLN